MCASLTLTDATVITINSATRVWPLVALKAAVTCTDTTSQQHHSVGAFAERSGHVVTDTGLDSSNSQISFLSPSAESTCPQVLESVAAAAWHAAVQGLPNDLGQQQVMVPVVLLQHEHVVRPMSPCSAPAYHHILHSLGALG